MLIMYKIIIKILFMKCKEEVVLFVFIVVECFMFIGVFLLIIVILCIF